MEDDWKSKTSFHEFTATDIDGNEANMSHHYSDKITKF